MFSSSLTAENPYLFQPDFSGQALPISQGTSIVPLCADPSSPLCFTQWTQQALPLASYFPNFASPQYNYFIPSFIPIRAVDSPENNDEWEEFYLPNFSSSSRRRRDDSRESSEDDVTEDFSKDSKKEIDDRLSVKDLNQENPQISDSLDKNISEEPKRRFYRSQSNPNQIRVVETNETGEKTVQEGTVSFININDIQAVAPSEEKKQPKTSFSVPLSPTSPTALPAETPSPTFTPIKQPLPPTSPEPSPPPKLPSSSELSSPPPIPSLDQIEATYTVSRDTQALPAGTKKVKPDCFVINRQEEETEAGFCVNCVRDENNNVLNSLVENQGFLSSLQNYLQKVAVSSESKVTKQTVIQKSGVQKICSPEISLKAVIDNFNKTCSPANDFEDFFKKAYCQSCQKGAPVEIMMSMMSIESAGRCSALAQNELEASSGLFQVDGKQHQCRDKETGLTYSKATHSNLQCLKNPINNLTKAIDILVDHYDQTNPKPLSKGQCKSWISLNSKERDSWRRGVSAYNGGPDWVTRAIKSARDTRTLSGTSYLLEAHKRANLSEEKNDTASWEQLRLFYFIEKLSPNNSGGHHGLPECNSFLEKDQGGTGRRLCLTVSNLAHTEAVLGREVKGSMGMVEIWSQYKRIFLKNHPITCP